MPSSSTLLAAALSLVVAGGASAHGRRASPADLDVYARLRDARALAELRGEGASPGPDGGFGRALRAAGWRRERFDRVDAIVADALGYLRRVDEDAAGADAYWGRVRRVDAATIALVKVRRGELEGTRARAERALRDERLTAALGRVATAAELQGTWWLDAEASRAHLASALAVGEDRARELVKGHGEHVFVFSGDRIESRGVRAGRAENASGTFRLEGRDLVVTGQGRREERLLVGLKAPDELVVGAFGVPSGVYRRR